MILRTPELMCASTVRVDPRPRGRATSGSNGRARSKATTTGGIGPRRRSRRLCESGGPAFGHCVCESYAPRRQPGAYACRVCRRRVYSARITLEAV
ncbi:unnamed protein product, partial [Trichogramma brassicae]